jgi:hypothetical protein
MSWKPCPSPAIHDVIRWKEPLWAPPNKKRGKPDQIGEHMLTATVVAVGDVLELEISEVEILSVDDGQEAPEGIKPGDRVRRKKSSIERGDCHKLHGKE